MKLLLIHSIALRSPIAIQKLHNGLQQREDLFDCFVSLEKIYNCRDEDLEDFGAFRTTNRR